jgi:arylsulfatase A-like enzyme
MEVPDLGQYAAMDWPPQQKAHAAMISRMDADIGRLLAKLKTLGIADNTLVFFSSDNGPHKEGGNDPHFNDSNGPLKGIKRDLTEGGIRVPFIARWPGKVSAGATSHFVGGFQDLMPTLAELAGAAKEVPAGIDGLSIVPTLMGDAEKQRQHDYLYWSFYERGGAEAVRIGKWKAIEQPKRSPLRLYDLSQDIGEEKNVAAEHADIVAKMKVAMQDAYVPDTNWRFPAPGDSAPKKKGKAKAKTGVN